MESPTNAIDLSGYTGNPKVKPKNEGQEKGKNKNAVYIAVIIVSFCLTVMLYAVAFRNQGPTSVKRAPLPAAISTSGQ